MNLYEAIEGTVFSIKSKEDIFQYINLFPIGELEIPETIGVWDDSAVENLETLRETE